jgi:hypothetical protein
MCLEMKDGEEEEEERRGFDPKKPWELLKRRARAGAKGAEAAG